MASEWLSFEQAGHMIEGGGWQAGPDGSRLKAQSLLMLAHKGIVATNARIWSCVRNTADVGKNRQATLEERSEFLQMLFSRERNNTDRWNMEISPAISIHAAFSMADTETGNFEAIRLIRDRNRVDVHSFSVVGLTFKRSDIEFAFGGKGNGKRALAAASSPNLPRLPDSKLEAWWQRQSGVVSVPEAKLLEMARSAFPENSISRERVRQLIREADPYRKRGPKPIRDKNPAKQPRK